MTRLKFVSAVAVLLSSALASPVMAQQVITNPGYCAQFYPNANCQNNGPNSPYTGDYQRRVAYQGNHHGWNDNHWSNDSGFWPGDVAAGVVGGAIGTAGAIATAPFRSDAYAYYGGRGDWRPGEYNPSSNNYAARNGFVCQPGTWTTGEDGRRHICQ